MEDRFKDWEPPTIEDGKPTKYNWVVQNKDGLDLGFRTDKFFVALVGLFAQCRFSELGPLGSWDVQPISIAPRKQRISAQAQSDGNSQHPPGLPEGCE
jgi:hypothetical protein